MLDLKAKAKAQSKSKEEEQQRSLPEEDIVSAARLMFPNVAP